MQPVLFNNVVDADGYYTMRRTDTQDRIDRELTRTYFSGAIPDRPDKITGTSRPAAKRPARSRLPAVIISLLVCAILVAVYFLTVNRISFSVNISIEPQAERTAPAASKPASPLASVKKMFRLADKKYTAPKNANTPAPEDKILYDFDESLEGWEIPAWSADKPDHVGRSLKISGHAAGSGTAGAEMHAAFPGNMWAGAIAEVQHYVNLSGYDAVSADIYLPWNAPNGLRGKIIITAGDDWRFIEMARGIRLVPGEWTTVTADLSDDSMDWKRVKMDDSIRSDVRKIAVRVESSKTPYTGPIYIDTVRVSKQN